jgi:hypothetical protein
MTDKNKMRKQKLFNFEGFVISEFDLRTVLQAYSEYLFKFGYIDTDWFAEEPKAIDQYINEELTEIK